MYTLFPVVISMDVGQGWRASCHVSTPYNLRPIPSLQFRRGDLLDHVALDLVADLNVIEVLEPDTTLESFADFGGVVLKATKRSDITFPADHAVANQPRACIAANDSVDDQDRKSTRL